MSRLNEIKKLWNIFLEEQFPSEIIGKLISDIEPVEIDSTVAGCIDTFISENGNLDIWRCSILGLCIYDIAILLRELDGNAKKYFQLLENIVRLTLEDIRDNNKDKYI